MNLDGGLHEIPLGVVPGDAVPGRMWLCGKHVVGPDPEGVLARTGAYTIVCLTERHELSDRYPEYEEWLDDHVDDGRAIWLPMPDLHAPPMLQGRRLVDELVARLRSGDGLVIHCAAGIGRAGTTAVAVLLVMGTGLDDARAHVRAHRPLAGPEAGEQLDFLVRLAEEIARDVEPELGGEPQ